MDGVEHVGKGAVSTGYHENVAAICHLACAVGKLGGRCGVQTHDPGSENTGCLPKKGQFSAPGQPSGNRIGKYTVSECHSYAVWKKMESIFTISAACPRQGGFLSYNKEADTTIIEWKLARSCRFFLPIPWKWCRERPNKMDSL
jgi:hypothetical protein